MFEGDDAREAGTVEHVACVGETVDCETEVPNLDNPHL